MPSSKKSLHTVFPQFILVLFLITALVVGFMLLNQSQDIRQQAAGCNEEQVNVEFRKYSGPYAEKPGWKSGSSFNFKVGDRVDINCFSKTGTSLLTGGTFSATLDGKRISIPNSAYPKSRQEIRGFTIEEPGKYIFTCKNSRCSDSDSFTVQGKKSTPTPLPTAIPTATPAPTSTGIGWPIDPTGTPIATIIPTSTPEPTPSGCVNPSIADLNNDCTVNLLDYDLFLSAFISFQTQ